MESLEVLQGPELAAVTAIWVAQKRELVVAFGGTSMLPAIAPGQRVFLCCGVMPQIGDVAAFLIAGRIAVHRVVARADDGMWLVTWGDANLLPDELIDDPGRVVGTIRAVDGKGTMEQVPAAPRSLRRRLILRFALGMGKSPDGIGTRIALLYRVRNRLVAVRARLNKK